MANSNLPFRLYDTWQSLYCGRAASGSLQNCPFLFSANNQRYFQDSSGLSFQLIFQQHAFRDFLSDSSVWVHSQAKGNCRRHCSWYSYFRIYMMRIAKLCNSLVNSQPSVNICMAIVNGILGLLSCCAVRA